MIKNNRAMKVKLLALKMLMCCIAVGDASHYIHMNESEGPCYLPL